MNFLSWLHKNHLSRQLLWSCGFSLASIGLGTLWINYQLIQADLEKQVRTRAQSITQSIEFASEGLVEIQQRHLLRRVMQNYGTLLTVEEVAIVKSDGIILSHSDRSYEDLSFKEKYPGLIPFINQASSTGIETSHEIVINQKSVLVQILPFSSVLFGQSGKRGLAIAILDLRQMRKEAYNTFLTSALTFFAGIVIFLIFMGVLIRRNILRPLKILNQAVANSKETATFSLSEKMPVNEIQFLSKTFQIVFEQLIETQEQLKTEIIQRQQSETRERNKSEELKQTLLELQKAQAQLVQSEKMSSLGQLVAGVAHEINNPVSFIYGNLQPLQEYTETLLLAIKFSQQQENINTEFLNFCAELDLDFIQEDVQKIINSMKIGTERIREIVLSLRNFSRLDEAEFKSVNIHEGFESSLMILQHRLKQQPKRTEIKVIKDYGQLPLVECHAGQLNQVFINILTNAIDAIEERMKNEQLHPTITINTTLIDRDWVKIAITDNGVGMSEHIQRQIFNPFFTTKPVGKSTGLGMSISYQIITAIHGGNLHCFSISGEGTEFIIKIPIHQSKSI